VKILFLNHNIRFRGTWFRCFHLARHLVRLRHEVSIITLSPSRRRHGEWSEAEGVRVFESPRWLPAGKHDGGWAPLDIVSRVWPTLNSSWDIIHAFGHRPNVSVPWYAAKWKGKSHCAADWCDWWTRGGIITPRRRFRFLDRCEAMLEERSKRAAGIVTVISETLRERARSIGIPEERIVLLPSGSDVEGIRDEYRIQCREDLGLTPDLDYVEFVGYAVWDLQMLFEAFALVRRQHPRARLLLVGRDKDRIIPRLREGYPLGATLIEVGEIPPERLSRVLGAADVHALPLEDTLANRARWPNKLGDYLASGRPVAVQEVGEAGDFVKRHEVGEVVAPTAEGLAEGILALLRDRERAREMGSRARRVAERELSWGKFAQILDAAYRELANTADDGDLLGPGGENAEQSASSSCPTDTDVDA
jgi:glycosyltransferase involved in cell wall biosynthesis